MERDQYEAEVAELLKELHGVELALKSQTYLTGSKLMLCDLLVAANLMPVYVTVRAGPLRAWQWLLLTVVEPP